MKRPLPGTVALVTGASGAIGASTLADEGVAVVVTRRRDLPDELAPMVDGHASSARGDGGMLTRSRPAIAV